MSAVSGQTSKGENKSSTKQKYQSLNINNLYKGKSLETQKTGSVAPKHGLQTLGKVGAGRRMPPPANLPSLKSQTTSTQNITLVPSGGQGWGQGKEEDSRSTPPLQTSSSGADLTQLISQKPIAGPLNTLTNTALLTSGSVADTNVGGIALGLAANQSMQSKSWSTVTATVVEHQENGPDVNYLAQESPFFPQEFPKLDGGGAPQDSTTKANADTSYGPGPILRPQTEGSWGRGTAPQPGSNNGGGGANQLPNAGNAGLGGQLIPSAGAGGPPPSSSVGNEQNKPVYPHTGSGGQPMHTPHGPPLLPGQTPMNYNQQYRMMTPYPPHMAYPRGAYPGPPYPPQGYPPPPHGPMAARQPYYPDSRGQRLDDESSGGRQNRSAPTIITDKDLKGFDDILENASGQTGGWAAANAEIDYNAKLVFSDDEDQPTATTTKERSDSYGDTRSNNSNENNKRKDWERKDYDRGDERPKYKSQQHQQQQQQWQQQHRQQHPNQRNNNRINSYEHSRDGPPPPSGSYSKQIHSNYSHSRQPPQQQPPPNRSEPMVADDDEMWRQRSQQQTDEMAAAVVRARQRREEEEKKMERSRQAAHEKLRYLEEKASHDKPLTSSADKTDIDFDQSSRHSSENRDDKVGRDMRDIRTRDYPRDSNFPGAGGGNKYPKNVPPRFQRLQNNGQSNVQKSDMTYNSNRLPSESDSRDVRDVRNNQIIIKSSIGDNSRSNSQISSGHESIESEKERRTPDYDSAKDRRHRSSHSGSDSQNWRTGPKTPLTTEPLKDLSDSRLPDDKDSNKFVKDLHRDSFFKDNKQRDDNFDHKVVHRDQSDHHHHRELVERQESSHSSHSDRRSVSSKEDKYANKNMNWGLDSDNYGTKSVHHQQQRRDHNRHGPVPITQKQFESITEPIKKNFTPLKKLNQSTTVSSSGGGDTTRDTMADKLSDSTTIQQTNQTLTNENLSNKCNKMDNQLLSKEDITKPTTDVAGIESIDKEMRESDSHLDKNVADKDLIKKDDKNQRKSSSNRYDAPPYAGRDGGRGGGRYSSLGSGANRGRVKEYRPTRTPSHGSSRNKSNSFDGSDDMNRKDGPKEVQKSNATTTPLDTDDNKREYDRDKSDPNISATSSVVPPNQRNDLSRRGRGMAAFKTTSGTRGMPRAYGPSNYGPPPSKAAFGDGSISKTDNNRNYDHNRNEKSSDSRNSYQNNRNSFRSMNDETSYHHSSREVVDNNRNNNPSNRNKSNSSMSRNGTSSVSNSNNNNKNRTERLPPRLQNRSNRSHRGSERSGSGSRLDTDMHNEEWETASDNSEAMARGDRRSNNSNRRHLEHPSRDNRDKRTTQDRRSGDNYRGHHGSGGVGAGGANTTHRGGGNANNRNQSTNSSHGLRSSTNNSQQQPNGSIDSTTNRDVTVFQLSGVTLDNPDAIKDAINSLNNKNNNNEEDNDVLDNDDVDDEEIDNSDDGFKTIERNKRRNRPNQTGNDNKKVKHEINQKSKGAAPTTTNNKRSPKPKSNHVAPRFAKQKANNDINSLPDGFANKITDDFKSLSIVDPKTVATDAIAKTLPDKLDSTTTASNTSITTVTKTTAQVSNSQANNKQTSAQALSTSSKSSSFDQHDSGVEVSDHPPSTASSQRSSPSNDDNKMTTTTAKSVGQVTDKCTDIVTDLDAAKPMCTVIFENTRYKEENKVLAKIVPAKSPSAKEMYSNSTLVNSVDTETGGHSSSQLMSVQKKTDSALIDDLSVNDKSQISTNVAKVVGMQRTNLLPTESDLNVKIASTRKVWENPSTTSASAAIESPKDTQTVVFNKNFDDNDLINNSNHCHVSDINITKVSELTKVHYSSTSMDQSMHTMNKNKASPITYTTPTPNQMSSQYISSHQSQQQSIISSQILVNAINSPPLVDNRSVQNLQPSFQIHNIAANPAISTPPTMLYNTHVGAHNVYHQPFNPQLDSLQAVMAQFPPQHNTGHYSQQLMQSQQNLTNIYMAHQMTQPTANDQYKQMAAAHQSSLTKTLPINQFAVHQNNSSLSNTASWTTPAQHNQTNNQTANYYPQSSSVNNALQGPPHFAFQSQPSIGLMSSQPSQTIVQPQYRPTPLSIGRNPNVEATNTVAANMRSMFTGGIINDHKLGNSVNPTMDARNSANRTLHAYTQGSSLQHMPPPPHQQQMYGTNPKYASRPMLPNYAQQMLGQVPLSARPNSAAILSSNVVNLANNYNTPIQRPKVNHNNNRNNNPNTYVKNPHQQHVQQQQQHIQQQHQQHVVQQLQQQQQSYTGHMPVSASLSNTQQAKMRQEAVRQTQSFFAQSSSTSSAANKNESQIESQISEEVSTDSVNTNNKIINDKQMSAALNADENKLNPIEKND
ncbi:homeobox protein 5-like isoform X2 [Oppia nitens]|uniref:homeobox protein 5-like isoform X2 n=1 Tax=Oppia nitens TaxID=1686743 RepID=UPI0023D9E249|nr:homeobox protein 5-like isoform X2 [Oppia nitens]